MDYFVLKYFENSVYNSLTIYWYNFFSFSNFFRFFVFCIVANWFCRYTLYPLRPNLSNLAILHSCQMGFGKETKRLRIAQEIIFQFAKEKTMRSSSTHIISFFGSPNYLESFLFLLFFCQCFFWFIIYLYFLFFIHFSTFFAVLVSLLSTPATFRTYCQSRVLCQGMLLESVSMYWSFSLSLICISHGSSNRLIFLFRVCVGVCVCGFSLRTFN